MSLFHGATADQLRAGDILIERATVDGTAVQFPSSVGFVYSTFPVLAAYSDGQGNSATGLTYPRESCPTSPCFGPLLPVRAGPNGDVVLTLTYWRPQRHRIEGDTGEGEWMDVGNLAYAAMVAPNAAIPPGTKSSVCRQSSYSGMDPNLTPDPNPESAAGPPTFGGYRLFDLSRDQPSNPANTFTFTLNLTDCLAANGLSMSMAPSTGVSLTAFTDTSSGGPPAMAATTTSFQLQP